MRETNELLINQALVNDIDSGAHFYEFRFRTITGDTGFLLYDRGGRHRSEDLLRVLLTAGAALPSDHDNATGIVRAAVSQEPERQYAVTSRTGWHNGVFVLPDRTIGDGAAVQYRPSHSDDEPLSKTAGSLSDFIDGLAKPCRASSYLTFAVALPLAATLLRLLGENEGAVFNLVGESSTGKTLAELVAQAVMGRAVKAELPTLGSTGRGVEELAYRHNDLALMLDELGRLEGGQARRRLRLRELAYTSQRLRQDPVQSRPSRPTESSLVPPWPDVEREAP